MKRIILVTLVALLAIPSVTMAQKGRKEVSPILEGKQKVRKTNKKEVETFVSTSFLVRRKGLEPPTY